MPKRAVEIGYAYKWFHRDVPSGPLTEIEWETASFFGRYGATDWLTLVAEGGQWTVRHDDFPGTYDRFTLGGGVAARFHRSTHWSIDGSVLYNETWDHDRSDYRFDKRTQNLNVTLMTTASFPLAGQAVELWAGPVYVDDVAENYPYGSIEPITSEADGNWGAAAGGTLLLWKHIDLLGYLLYADHVQARVGVALYGGGGE